MKKKSLLSFLPIFFGLTAPLLGQTIVSFTDVTRLDKSGGNSWGINGSTFESLLAGNASSSNAIFETAILIDISSVSAEIAAASSITFHVAYDAVLGDGQDVTAYFFGTDENSISSIGGQTFHDNAFAGDDAGTIAAGDFSAPGVATYEATSIVKSLVDSDYVAILLTSGLTSDPSSTAHDIRFYAEDTLGSQTNGGAYLNIASIPEPSTSVLLIGCLAGLVAVLRRR